MTSDENKSGKALEQQRFQMLRDIAGELSGDVVFPCHFDLVLRLRSALKAPQLSEDQLVGLLQLDPLLSARLVGLANLPDFGPLDGPVYDLPSAVARLGLQRARVLARKLVVRQFLIGGPVSVFSDLLFGFWRHSLKTASAALVLNRHFAHFDPGEAQLAGLTHDIGAFYMLFRAAQYEELRQRPETVKYLIGKWHDGLGHALLGALGLPSRLVDAVQDHDTPRPRLDQINSLSDLVHVANSQAGAVVEQRYMDISAQDPGQQGLNPKFTQLGDEIQAQFDELVAPLG
ncbi:MAG: HDOD domain-containing protein [Gammaproteobacteria bacterium SHHR-1]